MKLKLPLHTEPGLTASYLCDADGTYLVRSIGDSIEALATLERIGEILNGPHEDNASSLARNLQLAQAAPAWRPKAVQNDAVRSQLDAIFATMPIQPTDMADPEGLAAYAEAILQWRTDCGYPERYAEVRG